MARWRQITSSRMSAGRWRASIAPETVPSVAGATSWPRSIRPTSSSTTAAASRTSPSEPSSVRTLPRRWTSQCTRSSSSLRTESSDPASSAATVLSRVSCLRAKGPGRLLSASRRALAQALANRSANTLAVGAPIDLRHDGAHDLPHVLGLRSRLGNRGVDQLSQLLVAEFGGEVVPDHLRLGLLGRRAIVPAPLAEGGRRFDAPLALAPKDRDLVTLALLRVLLKGAGDHAQSADTVALASLHRVASVRLNAFENG